MKTFITIILNIFLVLNIYSQSLYDQTEILVHDYDSDICLKSTNMDSLKIDVDNDGVLDIMFYFESVSSGYYQKIKSLIEKCQIALIIDTKNDSLKSSTLVWHSDFTYLMGMFKSEKIGIQINENERNYYGWAHVIFSSENRERIITIDKYAFCTIPDYPLLWGQTELTGKKEIILQDKVKVSVDVHSKSINIQSKEVIKEISLMNSAGRVIQKWRNVKSSKVDISSEGIKGGVYLFRVKNMNNEVFTGKVVL
jgi:hypothetical protein